LHKKRKLGALPAPTPEEADLGGKRIAIF